MKLNKDDDRRYLDRALQNLYHLCKTVFPASNAQLGNLTYSHDHPEVWVRVSGGLRAGLTVRLC